MLLLKQWHNCFCANKKPYDYRKVFFRPNSAGYAGDVGEAVIKLMVRQGL